MKPCRRSTFGLLVKLLPTPPVLRKRIDSAGQRELCMKISISPAESMNQFVSKKEEKNTEDAGSVSLCDLYSGVRVCARTVLLRFEHQDGWQCRGHAENENILHGRIV